MRWTDFFSHLEHDFALDAHPPRESATGHDSVDTHFLDVCARAKVAGQEVTVGMVTGEVFHVSPRAISTDWFSGLVGGDRGSGVVIPLSAVLWVEGDAMAYRGERSPVVTATLSDVLTDMARRNAHVTVRTPHSDAVGVITGVGNGFCDLVSRPTTHLGATRRFPFHAIVAIFQGTVTWG
jgi:hypothetical protein